MQAKGGPSPFPPVPFLDVPYLHRLRGTGKAKSKATKKRTHKVMEAEVGGMEGGRGNELRGTGDESTSLSCSTETSKNERIYFCKQNACFARRQNIGFCFFFFSVRKKNVCSKDGGKKKAKTKTLSFFFLCGFVTKKKSKGSNYSL